MTLAEHARESLEDVLTGRVELPEGLMSIGGFCGMQTRQLIHRLCRPPVERYMEIGVLHGATLSAAACGNPVRAVGIDNFSQFDGDAGTVLRNLARTGCGKATLLIADCMRLDATKFPEAYEVLFYDGDHSTEATAAAIGHYLPALTNPFLLLVDDWMWDSVQDGVAQAVREYGLKLGAQWEMIPPRESDGDTFWNGLLMAEVSW